MKIKSEKNMKKIEKIIKFLAIYFLILFIFNSELYSNIGIYAIIIFGSSISHVEVPGDEDFVEYEVAPIFETLLSLYNFSNNNIYLHNIRGDSLSPGDYYQYFENDPVHYLPAMVDETNYITQTFNSVNAKLIQNDSNLVFIFMTGHQSEWQPGKQQWYSFRDDVINDQTFANWINNYLLKNDVSICFSLDGPKNLHISNRCVNLPEGFKILKEKVAKH